MRSGPLQSQFGWHCTQLANEGTARASAKGITSRAEGCDDATLEVTDRCLGSLLSIFFCRHHAAATAALYRTSLQLNEMRLTGWDWLAG